MVDMEYVEESIPKSVIDDYSLIKIELLVKNKCNP
jgi:hypothetical protein